MLPFLRFGEIELCIPDGTSEKLDIPKTATCYRWHGEEGHGGVYQHRVVHRGDFEDVVLENDINLSVHTICDVNSPRFPGSALLVGNDLKVPAHEKTVDIVVQSSGRGELIVGTLRYHFSKKLGFLDDYWDWIKETEMENMR